MDAVQASPRSSQRSSLSARLLRRLTRAGPAATMIKIGSINDRQPLGFRLFTVENAFENSSNSCESDRDERRGSRKSARNSDSDENKQFRTIVPVAQPTVIEIDDGSVIDYCDRDTVVLDSPVSGESGWNSPSAALPSHHIHDVNVVIERSGQQQIDDSSSISSEIRIGSPELVRHQDNNESNNAGMLAVCCSPTSKRGEITLGGTEANLSSGTPTIQLTNWRLLQTEFNAVPEINPTSDRAALDSSFESAAGHARMRAALRRHSIAACRPMFPQRFDEDFVVGGGGESKGCCARLQLTPSAIIRSFIAVISVLGLACVITGIVLGALTVSGSTRLTLCLLMIGVGIVLITVSGIAWRLTSIDPTTHPNCWTVIGLRGNRPVALADHSRGYRQPYRRMRSPRIHQRSPSVQHFPAFFHEIFWQPPPPSYYASMQQEQFNGYLGSGFVPPPPGSPPPTYHSHVRQNRPTLGDVLDEESRPPSYRSRTSPSIDLDIDVVSLHGNDATRPSARTGAAVVGTELVGCNDRQLLINRNGSNAGDSNQRCNSRSQNPRNRRRRNRRRTIETVINLDPATDDDRISIVDCSRQTPVGFSYSNERSPAIFPHGEMVLSAGNLHSPPIPPPPPRFPAQPFSAPLTPRIHARHRDHHRFARHFSPPAAMRIPRPILGPICYLPDPQRPTSPPPLIHSRDSSLLSVTDFLEITSGPSYV